MRNPVGRLAWGVGAVALVLGAILVTSLDVAEAGRRRPAPLAFRQALTILNSYFFYTDQQIVDIMAMYPPAYIMPNNISIRPVGHPDYSAADCVATPNSLGCRAKDIRALAASQGVNGNKICIAFRPDVHSKLPGYLLDEIDGVNFDPDWLIRVPGDEFEERLFGDYRNGLLYTPNTDASWANSLEPACCHNGVAGDCTAQDECLLRYGWGDDANQQLWTVTLLGDLRIPEYRQWTAGRLLARVADAEADCALLGYKPGWWTYYDGPTTAWECDRDGDFSFAGSSHAYDPCARESSPSFPNPYGPGEFASSMNALFDEIFAQMDAKGQHFPILTTERPSHDFDAWGWMANRHVQNSLIKGEMHNPIQPFVPPVPGLAVYLTPPPEDGVAPHLDVDLTVDVRGNASGPMDVYVWCDCTATTTNVANAQSLCGTTPGEYYELLGQTVEPIVGIDACDYPTVGTYVVKVIVEREGLAREDRNAVNVD